jgi:hypothetical protein
MTYAGISSVHDTSADININWNSTSRMSGSILLLSLYAFIAWTGITVPFFNLYLGFEQCTYKSSVPVTDAAASRKPDTQPTAPQQTNNL